MEADSWDTDAFVPEVPVLVAGPVVADRWAGEDEEDEVKDNWDDEEEEGADDNKKEAEKTETKVSEKKRLQEKIKEKELKLKKKEEVQKLLEEPEELTPEEQIAEKLRLKKLQEDSDLALAKEAFGDCAVTGLDAINPSSKEDFEEFGRLLKEKITHYEKSLHYTNFLETLLRDVCISLEVDDLKRISNSVTALYTEKQKQEKQNKAKKKKKGILPGGGFKANMKDDLADYGGYDAGFTREFDDFM